jgi:hypothetical protein
MSDTTEALSRVGEGGTYFEHLGPWLHMLQQGLTTWSEIDTPESRSDCHAWGASPNIEVFRTIVGVTPAKPGYTAVRIAPNLGALKSLHAVVPHPKGRIEVDLDTRTRTVLIRLPEGTPGEFLWNGRRRPLRPGENRLTLF